MRSRSGRGGHGLSGGLEAIPTDVTAEVASESVPETVQRHGRIDLLFNNAGIGAPLSTSMRSNSTTGTRWWLSI
jgi:NAD(P)-dependent dehydrogenase (short-subunit alcohol dehydrogenase family)